MLAEAVEITRRIEGAPQRDLLLRNIAEVQASAGDVDGALAIARSIDHPQWSTRARCAIAEVQARVGDVDGALATARAIEDALDCAEALRAIAEAQVDGDDAKGAASTVGESVIAARCIGDMDDRAREWPLIVETQARSGDIEGALATARTIKVSSTWKEAREVTVDLLWAMLALVFRTEALLAKLQTPPEARVCRVNSMLGIAEVQAAAQDTPGARDTICEALAVARRILYSDQRAETLCSVAEALANIGDLDDALATARSIEDEDERDKALDAVARAQRGDEESEDDDEDESTSDEDIEEALRAADTMDESYSRDAALSQATAGNIEAALATARRIVSAYTRAEVVYQIAEVQVESDRGTTSSVLGSDILIDTGSHYWRAR